MNRPMRLVGALVALLAISLTGLGVAVAVAFNNGPSDAAFNLHGKTATTASATFSLTTGGVSGITGSYEINFNTDAMLGTIIVPGVFSSTRYSFIFVNGTLYLGVPSLANVLKTPWVSITLPAGKGKPDLFPYAFELSDLKVDIKYFLSHRLTITHNGAFTTYAETIKKGPISVPSDIPFKVPRYVTTHLAVTLASKGQFTALAASSSGRNFYVQFNLNITGYDQTLHIAAPPARLVQPLTKQLLTKALGSGGSSYAKLFSPQGIATLGQIRLG